jgi:phage baseplate assembly protein W
MSERFIGRGWAFPLRVGPTGGIAMVEKDREIEEAIHLVLGTAPGERPMRPEFGCEVHDFTFDTIEAATIGKMEAAIRTALDRWEPRVEVQRVEFDTDRAYEGELMVTVTYLVRATNHMRNLVYPFYVIPAEEGGE